MSGLFMAFWIAVGVIYLAGATILAILKVIELFRP